MELVVSGWIDNPENGTGVSHLEQEFPPSKFSQHLQLNWFGLVNWFWKNRKTNNLTEKPIFAKILTGN